MTKNIGGQYVLYKTLFRQLFCLCVFIISFSPLSAHAQGVDFVDALRNGTTSPADAINSLNANSALSQLQSSQLVNSILENNNITSEAAGELVEGFLGDNSPITPDQIGNITNVIENFQKFGATPEAMLETAKDVVEQKITSEIAKGLSQIPGLGNINIENFGNLLDQVGVLKDLDDIAKTIGANAAAEALKNITGLSLNLENATQDIKDQATAAVVAQLETLAPDLFNALDSVLGDGATAAIITALLSDPSTTNLQAPDVEECTPTCSATSQCGNCAPTIHNNHVSIRNQISTEFEQHRGWFVNNFFRTYLAKALGRITLKLTATGIQQVHIVGSFFDAKHQLETQRLFQTLTAKAHKDYHPSQNLCNIGTNTRHFANSKRRAEFAQDVVATRMMHRQLNRKDGISYLGSDDLASDMKSRIDDFIEKYCDPNGGGEDSQGNPSFALLCANASNDDSQRNADVNFTATIENKLTLESAFTGGDIGDVTNDEENIFALGANLFAHQTLPIIPQEILAHTDGTPNDIANYYHDLRALAAKRSIAQNSFAAITGLRAQGEENVGPFLKAILAETGIGADEIEQYLGENPSYFAQEEVMMKLLYQNPTFYANLYDKPVNVERMGTALLALEIVQDRNIYDSLLRSEASLATLVETLLLKEHRRVSSNLRALNQNKRRRGGN